MLIKPMADAPLQEYHQQFDELLEDIAEVLMTETIMTLPSLMKGNAGVALFFSYYYLYTKDEVYLKKCQELTADALSYLEKIEMPAMFASGFPGIAWLVKHLVNMGLYPADTDSILEDIDQYVYQALPAYVSHHKSDLFYGYTGLALYFLERDTVHQPETIQMILRQLEADVYETDTAAYWKNETDNEINIGLAHGLAGTLKFISDLHDRFTISDNLHRLLDKSANWLIKQAYQTPGTSIFPNSIAIDRKEYPDSRLAWCYGDAGIATALLAVEQHTGSETLHAFNQQLLLHLATRPVNDAFIKYDDELQCFDNCLCHGTAGIAYLYFKIFLRTGDEGIFNKLNEWVAVFLDNLKKMLTSLKRLPPRKEVILNRLTCCDDYNLLHGISGAGLILLGMQQPRLREWDHIFLMG